MRAREALAAEVQQLPEKVGGYELIFPFNLATKKLAERLEGNEAHVVAAVRGELQAASALAAAKGDVSLDTAVEASNVRRLPPMGARHGAVGAGGKGRCEHAVRGRSGSSAVWGGDTRHNLGRAKSGGGGSSGSGVKSWGGGLTAKVIL